MANEKKEPSALDFAHINDKFKNDDLSIYKTPKGLNEETVNLISDMKKEPDWMREYRLKSLKEFFHHHQPTFGPDLSFMDFQDYTYFTRLMNKSSQSWDDVPQQVKDTFEKLGIPEAEREYLAGIGAQYESEA
ncbi:MAG: Fe-S cluster assembly protein SufB, partial [Bacilli bacterium]|nr:Fe-S cluster assembly protein SufB [Bacilli bacterium]